MSKRVISIVLILALVGGTLMVSARGWKTLGSGVEAEENIFYIGDSRENENYFIYSPNSVIRPTVVYGSKLCNYGKFSAMAELLQAKGYSVAGGINAGFFNTPSYQPLGIVVSDGILRSSDEPGYHAIGFRADGSAFIGEPNMTLSIAFNGEYFPLSGYNKARTRTGFTLLSGEYFKDTQNTEPGRDVILVPADRPFDIRVSGSYEFTVVDIIESDAAIALGEGMYTLSLNRSAATSLQTALDGLQRNQTVTLDIRSDPQWLEADSAIGSYIKLVTNGQIDSEYSLAPKADETHPRTAVGIKSDGTVIFYTVDGRQHNISDGLTSLQTAQRMAELGCVDALMLDGGGSTGMYVREVGYDTWTMLSHPSDYAGANGGGRERSVSTFIMLTAFEPGSGTAQQMIIQPESATVLKGSDFRFTLIASDETMRPVTLPDIPITLSPTADVTADTWDAYAEYNGLSVHALLTEIGTPDKIEVLRDGDAVSFLSVRANGTYSLDAKAYFNGGAIISTDNAYTWSITPELGSVDSEGNLTITASDGGGVLTVSAGETVAEIPVAIERRVQILEDFESGAADYIGEFETLIRETNKDYVHNGGASARIDYSGFPDEVRVPYIPLPLSVDADTNYISMWVYVPAGSDAGGIGLELGDGTRSVGGGFSSLRDDWQYLSLPLPEPGTDVAAITLSVADGASGSIWIDHITASEEPNSDSVPPTIGALTLDTELYQISATLTDNSGRLTRDNIRVSADGDAVAFTFDASSGALLATVGGATRVTVTASDNSGNLARASLDISALEQIPAFPDVAEYWALNYVNYMSAQGIVTGFEQPEGGYLYKPDSEITRAQFAVMLYRFMKADASDVPIDALAQFEDINDIPEWATEAVAWAVSEGYINGVGNLDTGAVNFRPSYVLSRAQAMTILGRIQLQGFAPADLSAFPDYAELPLWSVKYVAALVGQGVINGRDGGKLMPYAPLTRGEVAKILTLVR